MTACLGLFLAAFVAATVLPAQSELLLAGLTVGEVAPIAVLVTVASVGNILGSLVNWLLGRGIDQLTLAGRLPVAPSALDRARRWYGRYGRWSLLLSWLPVIGDPLTVVAGVLREPLASFLLLVSVAKVARYLAVVGVVRGLS